MKELFLVGKKTNPENFFKFVPYRYGPCSFEVYHDLDRLKTAGFIQDVASPNSRYSTYQLTKTGRELAKAAFDQLPEDVRKVVAEVKTTFNGLSIYSLLGYVYDAYPEFATKTEWVFR